MVGLLKAGRPFGWSTFPGGNEMLPEYVRLFQEGRLHERAEEAMARLARCRLCPRHCDVNRL